MPLALATYGFESVDGVEEALELNVDERRVVEVLEDVRVGEWRDGGIGIDERQIQQHGGCFCVARSLEILLRG